jgi:tetratricopeptide (TPR) repeat protein
MGRNALAVFVLAAGSLVGCDRITQPINDWNVNQGARERVTTILTRAQAAQGRLDQKALCFWYNGTAVVDALEQSFASDSYDRWTVAGGLEKGLTSFEITGSTVDAEAATDTPTALVSGTIDGRPFTMRVPKGKPIEWVLTPKGKRSVTRRAAAGAAPRAGASPSARSSSPLEEGAPAPRASRPRTAIGEARPADLEGVGAAPLSSEEQAAVGFALLYLRGGAAGWQKMLSADSPWHSLPLPDAMAEIAARVGPPDGTRWQLQHPGPSGEANQAVFSVEYPSGMTETLWLEIVSEAGTMKLRRVRALSEPWPWPPRPGNKFEQIALLNGAPGHLPGAWLLAAALLGALLLAALGWRSGQAAASEARRRRLGWTALALAGIGFACARGGDGPKGDKETAAEGPTELRALVPLREALAEGASGDALSPLLAGAPRDGAAGDVARLWRADRMLRDYRLNEADTVLATFPSPGPYPLAALLRARLAMLRGKPGGSLEHYELVRSLGADDDGMRLDAAIALSVAEEEQASDHAFSRLTTLGSRLAIPYYVAAENAMAEDRPEEAEKLFQIAWELQPLSRDTLFGSPLLAAVCTRKAIYPLIDAGSAAEPRRGGQVPGQQPLPVPADAQASLVGGLLRIRLYGAELRVPGGAVLAPAGTVVEAADLFERSERDAQVEQLAVLTYQASVPGAFAQPVLRRRLELAAVGLAEQERWADLLALTDKLPAFDGRLPPKLTRLRAAALARSDRAREAFELLVRLAQDDKLHGRRDTGTLYQLADALVREQKYDLALKVLHRANAISGLAGGAVRERQVRMEKKLADAHLLFETPHFRIRYPRLTGEVYARQLAVVLEEERKRLSRWIPVAKPQPVDVDLYPVHEFLSSYATEMPVVGIFDGRVRVPFADLHSLHPQLVAILTHELAHALIAQSTGDRAPHWVQEGLAQHVEMVQKVHNPFPDLEPAGLSLSLAVVEHALRGFSEQQFVEDSYAEAAWAFHYLEAKHGTASIHRLLAAFARGADSDAALQAALGMDTARLDSALRTWATTPGLPRLWPTKLRKYDDEAERLALTARPEPPPAHVVAGAGRFTDPHNREIQAMARWHASYLRWAQPLKVAYTPVQKALSSGTWSPAVEAPCRQLAVETERVMSQPMLFRVPDSSIDYPLRQAIISLNRLGMACGHGDVTQARGYFAQAQQWLEQTATLFAKHKLAL